LGCEWGKENISAVTSGLLLQCMTPQLGVSNSPRNVPYVANGNEVPGPYKAMSYYHTNNDAFYFFKVVLG